MSNKAEVHVCPVHGEFFADAPDSPCPSCEDSDELEIIKPKSETWAIYSPTEMLWWSNGIGWVSLDFASIFSTDEQYTLSLPAPDGIWIRLQEGEHET